MAAIIILYYFDFALPPSLPLAFLISPLSPPHPVKVLFFADLLESTSFSLPLLAQLQTAATSLKKKYLQNREC